MFYTRQGDKNISTVWNTDKYNTLNVCKAKPCDSYLITITPLFLIWVNSFTNLTNCFLSNCSVGLNVTSTKLATVLNIFQSWIVTVECWVPNLWNSPFKKYNISQEHKYFPWTQVAFFTLLFVFMAGWFAFANHNFRLRIRSFEDGNISDIQGCLQYDLLPFNYLDQHAEPVAASTGAQTPLGWEPGRGTNWGGLWHWKPGHQQRSLYCANLRMTQLEQMRICKQHWAENGRLTKNSIDTPTTAISYRFQLFHILSKSSMQTKVSFGVPRGSVFWVRVYLILNWTDLGSELKSVEQAAD